MIFTKFSRHFSKGDIDVKQWEGLLSHESTLIYEAKTTFTRFWISRCQVNSRVSWCRYSKGDSFPSSFILHANLLGCFGV